MTEHDTGTPVRRRRADAERSIEAILDATLDQVLADGELNMVAIAKAAGVGRVTLYSHFPGREALLDAALRRAVESVDAALAATPLDEGRAAEVLASLLGSSWQMLHRYRNLFLAASAALSPAALRAHHQLVLDRVERLIERGRAEGDFRTDLPTGWLVATIYTLLHLAAEELLAGRLAADQAGRLLTATVLSVMTGSGGGPARDLAVEA